MGEPQVLYYLTRPPSCEPCHWSHKTVPATRRASAFCIPQKRKLFMCEAHYQTISTSTGWVLRKGEQQELPRRDEGGDSFDWDHQAGMVDIFRCFSGRFKTLREVATWAYAHAEWWGLEVTFEGMALRSVD